MSIFIIVGFVILAILGWPLIPGRIKHSDQDKRREAYQKRIKEEQAKRAQAKETQNLEKE